MIMLEITSIGIQILLPLVLVAWIAFAPLASRIGFTIQAIAILSLFIALALTALWMIPPWWVPLLYFTLWLLAILKRGTRLWRGVPLWPRGISETLSLLVLLPLGVWAISLSHQALAGRIPPQNAELIDLRWPMGEGTYLVANGGATKAVNNHLLTLDPKTKRQLAYRGQSFGIDLVKVNHWGLRAQGWRPTDPSRYYIFGEPVFAPCQGSVLAAADGMPDMPVPTPDTTLLEGNHVILDCGDYIVLLAHLRQGSLLISPEDHVQPGQAVGQVGNSGHTFEPHLHIHVQRHPASGKALLSGEPLQLKLDGRFLVRNGLMRIAP